ncbi:hypothetical protein BY458DRAFT_520280 [Sporodiniella umbellata]|nr:hypothetical protein BY458DRAFT_520280 [Sporodiniella umbellata]
MEKSWPHIDDWLFETMTVRLPRKLHQLQQWWTETGQPKLKAHQTHFVKHTGPRILEAIEAGGLMVYQFGCVLQSIAQRFIVVWRRFAASHNWKQLAEDLCEAIFGVVAALWRLAELGYRGCYQATISIKEDIIWLGTWVPPILDRLFSALHWMAVRLQILVGPMVWIKENLVSPTLGRVLILCIKGIDHLLLLIQNNSHRLEKIYRFLLPQLVWLLTDTVQTGSYSAAVIERVYQETKPVFVLFVKYVLPRLSAGYRKLRNNTLLWLSPVWSYVIPYIQSIADHIAFRGLQLALIKCISELNNGLLDKHLCCRSTSTEIYQWTSEQSQSLYASLERSLTTWADEKK